MERVSFVESVEYYRKVIKNKTKLTQVFYDAHGDAVTLLPGESKEIIKGRAKGIPVTVAKNATKRVKEKTNVNKSRKSSGTNTARKRKSKH